mmetsp:Transcript_7341/g.17253  ORF Transcript_7341/g.17253 Transcript_7341/m.17253 type:complete len:310 (-) Transcript_7341:1968-2897(-)
MPKVSRKRVIRQKEKSLNPSSWRPYSFCPITANATSTNTNSTMKCVMSDALFMKVRVMRPSRAWKCTTWKKRATRMRTLTAVQAVYDDMKLDHARKSDHRQRRHLALRVRVEDAASRSDVRQRVSQRRLRVELGEGEGVVDAAREVEEVPEGAGNRHVAGPVHHDSERHHLPPERPLLSGLDEGRELGAEEEDGDEGDEDGDDHVGFGVEEFHERERQQRGHERHLPALGHLEQDAEGSDSVELGVERQELHLQRRGVVVVEETLLEEVNSTLRLSEVHACVKVGVEMVFGEVSAVFDAGGVEGKEAPG